MTISPNLFLHTKGNLTLSESPPPETEAAIPTPRRDHPLTAEEFDRFLRHRLCWVDGTPTHGCCARQRQCPHCRRKWSYDRLLLRWELSLAFAADKSRRASAGDLGVDLHTAGRVYAKIEERLVQRLAVQLSGGDAGEIADREEMLTVWKDIVKLRTTRAKHRHLVTLGMRHLDFNQRVDLIFQLCFREGVLFKGAKRMMRSTYP